MKETFKKIKFDGSIRIKLGDTGRTWTADKRTLLNSIIEICNEYQNNGDSLTLRQLYYQLVSKDAIPNHDKVYKKLSTIKDELVYSGNLDWSIFEDRGRIPIKAYYENSVAGALERTVDYYCLDRQKGQTNLIEVWTEKDAISGILRKVTDPYTISLVVNKGYISSTAIYNAYKRFSDQIGIGNSVTILYFGDHDPSGLDMIRDIRERLEFMFNKGQRLDGVGYGAFKVIPIGLTMDQIKTYNPPPNPAKITDPRAANYIAEYGPISWEVDALKPDVMRSFVKEEIIRQMNIPQYSKVLVEELKDQAKIRKLIDNI